MASNFKILLTVTMILCYWQVNSMPLVKDSSKKLKETSDVGNTDDFDDVTLVRIKKHSVRDKKCPTGQRYYGNLCLTDEEYNRQMEQDYEDLTTVPSNNAVPKAHDDLMPEEPTIKSEDDELFVKPLKSTTKGNHHITTKSTTVSSTVNNSESTFVTGNEKNVTPNPSSSTGPVYNSTTKDITTTSSPDDNETTLDKRDEEITTENNVLNTGGTDTVASTTAPTPDDFDNRTSKRRNLLISVITVVLLGCLVGFCYWLLKVLYQRNRRRNEDERDASFLQVPTEDSFDDEQVAASADPILIC